MIKHISEYDRRICLIDGDIMCYRIAAMTHEEGEWKIVKFELEYYLKEVILKPIEATHYIGFFTGKNNFRKRLTQEFNEKVLLQSLDVNAGTKEYKGSRTDTRPTWWRAIQNHLCDVWGFEFVDGMEADDALAICQKKNSILCSNDHDFQQVPGWHYDYTKKVEERKLVYISPEEAYYNKWKQVITGCNTDEVEGIKGAGPATAEKYLAKFQPEEYPAKVKELYIEKYKEQGELRYELTVQLITLLTHHNGFTIPTLREVPTVEQLKEAEIDDSF